ncbi:MAG: enoyl-CoA hydratase-related protein [Rhodospirillales bacterium]
MPISHTVQGAVFTVVIDNPSKLNALTRDDWAELGRTMTALSGNDAIRCIVVRGAGDKAFSAGADISEFPETRANAAQARAYGAIVAEALQAIQDCAHPTLAMINGVCTGGGAEIACSCDIRIAGASARFGVPINRLGHAFAYAEMAPVLAVLGRAMVLELLLEGRILDAAEAERRGLVSRVVADGELEAEVAATAARIAEGAPLANRMTKRFVRRLADPRPLSAAETAEAYALCDSSDYAEGLAAFLAKRKPKFEGR